MNSQEMLDKLQHARSWKEFGYTIQDVYAALSNQDDKNQTKHVEDNEEIKMLKEKVERLSETNKQLRAENKALKGKK